jgi:S1-C subfamily serine protease
MRRIIIAGATLLLATAGALPADAQERGREPVRGVAAVRAGQGWLGLTFNYDPEEARRGGRTHLTVTGVAPGSPAARAEIRSGDRIVRLQGDEDVAGAIGNLRLQAGDTVRVRLQRAGQRDRNVVLVADPRPLAASASGIARVPGPGREVRVVRPGGVVIVDGDTIRIPMDSLRRDIELLLRDSLAPRLRMLERELPARLQQMDSAFARAFPEGFVFEVGRRAVAGAEFTDLNPELAAYFDGAREGLLVTRVAPESPAGRAGLRSGDVVVRANGSTVRTTAELRRIVAQSGRDEVRLDVIRRGRTVALRMR